jgi:hypothetical protein
MKKYNPGFMVALPIFLQASKEKPWWTSVVVQDAIAIYLRR